MLRRIFGGVNLSRTVQQINSLLDDLARLKATLVTSAAVEEDGDGAPKNSTESLPPDTKTEENSKEVRLSNPIRKEDDDANRSIHPKQNKDQEEIKKKITEIREKILTCCEKLESIAYGEEGKAPDPTKCQKLANALIETNAIKRLIVSISDLDFEARKSVSKIFSAMVTNDYGEFRTKFLLAAQNRDILDFLVRSYSKSSEIVLVCGEMLRVCLEHDAVVKVVLTQETLSLFFKEYLHRKNFTIQSDALSTMKILVENDYIATFLADEENYKFFFKSFHNELVLSFNEYVTVRESLKLLGEMLLKRSNYKILMKYIGDKQNLKTIMTVMAHKAAVIKLEAFHVFKVFAANPKKTPPIEELLCANREALLTYLERFHGETDDKQTREELNMIVSVLKRLGNSSSSSSGDGGAGDDSKKKEDDTSNSTTSSSDDKNKKEDGASRDATKPSSDE